MTVIKAYLAQYEVYLWAALAMLLLIGGVVVVHHIEVIGEDKVKAADAKAAAAQVIHTQEVEQRAQELMATQASQLHTALAASNPVVPFSLSVCPDTPKTRPVVPSNGTPGPSSVSGQVVRATVAGPATSQGVDIAPDTDRVLKQADATVNYWKSYYQNCVKEGACKAQTP